MITGLGSCKINFLKSLFQINQNHAQQVRGEHMLVSQCNMNVIAATECDIRLQSIMTLAEVHCTTFFIDHYKPDIIAKTCMYVCSFDLSYDINYHH